MPKPATNRPLLSLICAMDSNRLIGKNNALPWHLPADLAFFKRTTMGKPVIMGRKTFESIGKPLPGRPNIIVTRNSTLKFPGCDTVDSIDQAMALVQDSDEAMLIGGASLYQQSIDRADHIYLTLIHHSFHGDTWFPEIRLDQWNQLTREDFQADSNNPYSYSLIKYTRENKTILV
ncbi:MAG: type 3 dihydrofolate reductase [Gammaproteobacteria bacterium]|nr:MAG: type 3 dihydrofolate reductase [Gammaproteobacteria bacterium]